MYYKENKDMGISIRLTDKETEMIRKYAELKGKTVSDVVRYAILNQIEDEFDLAVFEEALKDYEKNLKSYTLDEVKKLLDL